MSWTASNFEFKKPFSPPHPQTRRSNFELFATWDPKYWLTTVKGIILANNKSKYAGFVTLNSRSTHAPF